ncbi:MAG: FKBP-type peptidyl-prolyl cis-trans isomerase [Halobacteriota archaeon]
MVTPGKTAIVHYTARMVDGEDAGAVVDTTDVDVALENGVYHGHRNYEPLSFEVGSDEVLPGLDEAVQKMDRGETRTVVLPPSEAFGEPDPERIVAYPRETIEARSDTTASVGELVTTDDDQSGWITDVSEETVTVDFNHELAGENLEFEVRVIDVQ